jgi:hypothetical protein
MTEENERASSDDVATAHGVDGKVTPDDEAAADRAFDDPELSGDHEEVAEHYREMTGLGAHVKGEGQLP